MGLTWIDYEEIDKPIEEIAQGTREADDIEFHVETLTNAKELDTQGDGKYFGGSNNLGKPSKKDVVGGIKVKITCLPRSSLQMRIIFIRCIHSFHIPL